MENNSNAAGASRSFAEAFDNQITRAIEAIRPSRIVMGKVVKLDKEFVHVDVNFKSVGAVPKEEFYNLEQKLTCAVGDYVEVFVVALENEDNQILLSHERAKQIRIWKDVEDKFENGGVVTGRVQHKVKGGLQVDIGIPAFLPGSQVDIKPHKTLDRFIGNLYDFKVLKITKDKGNIVVSRRSLLLSEREELRSETLKALSEGVVLEGTVKNITDYGAFVDLGGIDGLLHITDITWSHIDHPSDKLSVGQKVPVVVVSYDEEKERVSLGMKQLTDDPWEKVQNHYSEGQKVTGKVVSTADFGVHVELQEGIDGFLHVDDISWTKRTKSLGKAYSKGQEIEAVITKINPAERKLSLSVKHLGENPWDTLHERFPVGAKVTGKVRSITDFGIFVGVEDGIDGLVHLSDISWLEKFKDSNDLKNHFKKGADVEALILDINRQDERLSLGIKQLSSDPWPQIIQRYPVGTKVKGAVAGVADYGVFVQLEENVQGMVHKSELGLSKKNDIHEAYPLGKEIECMVISVDQDSSERRIGLSIRASRAKDREQALANFNDDMSGPTLGDLLQQKLNE